MADSLTMLEPDCLEKVRRAGVVVGAWPTDPEAEAVARKVAG